MTRYKSLQSTSAGQSVLPPCAASCLSVRPSVSDRYSVRVGMATPGRQVNSRCRRAALICIQSDDAASWLGPPRPAPAQCPVKVTDAAASVARSGPAVWDRMKLTRCHLRCCRYHLDCGCGDWTCAAVFDRPRLSVSVSLSLSGCWTSL